jgi:hypothetical protein
MGKVNVTWLDSDGVMDKDYIEHGTAYRLDAMNIVSLVKKPGYLEIEEITFETDEGIIVDERIATQKRPIIINIENTNLDRMDICHESVVNFAKYLLTLRDAE